MELRTRIRELRKEQKVSQEAVARAIGITLRNYQRIENGEGLPSFSVFCGLADHFQVNLDYLAGRTNMRAMPPGSEEILPD